MIEIPKQLQREDIRFILIAEKSKVPLESKWTTENNYKFSDPKLIEHLKNNGNCGVLCGYNNTIVIDIDNIDLIEQMDATFKDTLTIKTGGGKRQYYLFLEGEIEQNYIVLKDGAGELRIKNCQVVAPNSIHPSGNKYEIINDKSIQKIKKKELFKLLEDFLDISGKTFQKQISVDTPFIETHVFPKLGEYSKNLITKDSKSYVPELYGFPSRSERDQKIVVTLLLKGFGQYVKSIFELYPIGDKYKEHSDGDAYLRKCIESGRKYTGITDDIAITLEEELNSINVRVLRNKLDFYLQKISTLEKWSDIKYLTGLIALKTMISKKDLEKRIETLKDEGKEEILFSVEDIMKLEITENQFYIENFIPEKSIIFIQGKPESFKSMLAMFLCICMIAETPIFNNFKIIKKPKILYYDLENEIGEIKKRMKHILKGLDLSPDIMKGSMDICKSFKLKNSDKELVKCKDYDIIVLDSYRRFLEGDENQSINTNKFYTEFIKKLQDMGKTSITIMHEKKGDYENFKYTGARLEMVRGSGDIGAQPDLVFAITKLFEGKKIGTKNKTLDLHVSLEKNRKSIDFDNFVFHVENNSSANSIVLSFSNYGRPPKPRERLKTKIIEFINQRKIAKRKEIVTHITNSTDYTEHTIFKVLTELISNKEILQDKTGEYKAIEEIEEDTTLQETLK